MKRWGAFFVATLLCVGLLPSPVAAGSSQYFPETGQTSGNAFYEFWQTHGALPILGLPLSPVYLNQDSRIVQVYERATMEWHPENTRENRVQIRRLGDAYLSGIEDATTHQKTGDIRRHTPPRGCGTTSDCETFTITNHTVLGAFRDYWYANGGLPTFGLPLTEEYSACDADDGPCARSFSAQIFERNVFEWHPEVNGGAVLLRRLGALLNWTDSIQTSVARNPSSIRTVPDYDGVPASPNTSPPPASVDSAPTVAPPQQGSTTVPTADRANVSPGYHASLAVNASITGPPASDYPGTRITILSITDNAKNCYLHGSEQEKRCLVLGLEVGNVGTEYSPTVITGFFRLRDTEDREYEGDIINDGLSGHRLGVVAIEPGGKAKRGEIAFVVPIGATVKFIEFKTPMSSEDQAFYFDAPQ